ncbi:MAG: hypothetical protein C4534_01890 [Gaiellales bacterium]|nr:MAG: hypothetical protein C4534_01890 [Gaiellales bacterium]
MDGIAILFFIIAIITTGAAVALAVLFFRLSLERKEITSIVQPEGTESLARAVRKLAVQAAVCDEVPRLKSRYDQLLLQLPMCVLVLDKNRKIIAMSARAGTELDEPQRGRTLLETLENHELDSAAATALRSVEPLELEVRLYAGGRRSYAAKVVPYRTEQDLECLVFLRDISENIKFGELRSQFAATVSHELRTPLAGIQGLVESLQDPDISGDDSRRFLEKVDKETHRLGQLIDEILFLSSLESGSVEELKGETDLFTLVNELTGQLKPLADQREVTIKSNVPADAMLPLKERMAATVMSNLIQNAVNYSGIGSRVDIEAGRDGGQLRVTVRDDGIGIDAEHLPHIFERFYRVDKSRSKSLGGTGLGLSIVKHIIESAGGAITATSREGFGTEISFTLPL